MHGGACSTAHRLTQLFADPLWWHNRRRPAHACVRVLTAVPPPPCHVMSRHVTPCHDVQVMYLKRALEDVRADEHLLSDLMPSHVVSAVWLPQPDTSPTRPGEAAAASWRLRPCLVLRRHLLPRAAQPALDTPPALAGCTPNTAATVCPCLNAPASAPHRLTR